MRIELIFDPDGMIVYTRGPVMARIVRDRLVSLELDYTEHRTGKLGWSCQFMVTLPHGPDTGRIRDWLRQRSEHLGGQEGEGE